MVTGHPQRPVARLPRIPHGSHRVAALRVGLTTVGEREWIGAHVRHPA